MTIAWHLFTPWHALAGGLLIGLASALYLLGNGRVAGIAGIVASPLRALLSGGSMAPERTRLLFIGGLLIAPWIWRLFAPLPIPSLDVGTVGLELGGFRLGCFGRDGAVGERGYRDREKRDSNQKVA